MIRYECWVMVGWRCWWRQDIQRTECVSACERETVWTDVTEIWRLNMIRPPLQSPLWNIACCQIMRELAYFHKVRDVSLAHSLPVHPLPTWNFQGWNELEVAKLQRHPLHLFIFIYLYFFPGNYIYIYIYIQVHLNKLECREKVIFLL